MNRQARRKMFGKNATEHKEATYVLTESRLAELIDEGLKRREPRILPKIYALALGAVFINLRDNFGFGAKRIRALANNCVNTFESVSQQRVTLAEISQQVYEETGVKLIVEKTGVRVISKEDDKKC